MSYHRQKFNEEQFEMPRIKVREKRSRNVKNFKNVNPRQLLEDWEEDSFYDSFERYQGKRR